MNRYKGYETLVVPSLAAPFFGSVIAALDRGGDGLVVDLACGTGATGRAVAASTGASVVHVDVDPAAVAFVLERSGVGAWVIVAGAESTPLRTGSACAVVVQQGVQFFTDYAAAAREQARVLAAGGLSVVLSWTGDDGIPLLRELDHVLSVEGLSEAPRWDRARSFHRQRWVDSLTQAGLEVTTDVLLRHTLLPESVARLVPFFIDDPGSRADRVRAAARAHLDRLGAEVRTLTAALVVARTGVRR